MLILRNIRQDTQTGNYIAYEAVSKYDIPKRLYPNLYEFIKAKPTGLIFDWYHGLDENDKIEIKQSSMVG